MNRDLCLPCDEGFVNLRVGAIIQKDGKLLMVGNDDVDYLYSVGGRIRFGETAEQAVVREVEEETGTKMEIDRLGFVEENYFYADIPTKAGKLIYELGSTYPDIKERIFGAMQRYPLPEWEPKGRYKRPKDQE